MMRLIPLFIFSLFFIGMSSVHADQITYNDNDRRDPLWPLVSASGTIISYDSDLSADDLVLEGIISDKVGYLAILNGKIVKKGDDIFGSYVVQDVSAREVTLEKSGEIFTLMLKPAAE